MKENHIPYLIGAFIFISLIAQTFIQLTDYGWAAQSEALLFIGLTALVYFLTTFLYQKQQRKLSLMIVGTVGVIGAILIFVGPTLLGGHS